ncbi:MAG: prepilin-type N-terminal cleavage/methylation domain-containing protein [bacterium]
MNANRAFTLIELLTVVAIIAILAAIAVPNFLEAQIRSKISRTVSDMAVVSAALRSYYADNNHYPHNNPELRDYLTSCSVTGEVNEKTVPTPIHAFTSWNGDDPAYKARPGNKIFDPGYSDSTFFGGSSYYPTWYPILNSSGFDLAVLTTPIAYHTRALPIDPFHDRKGIPLLYINLLDLPPPDGMSMSDYIQSPGDGTFKRYLLLSYGPDTDSGGPHFRNPVRGPFIPYDVTNGTISPGDIFRFGN